MFNAACAFFASFGFAILFHIKGKKVFYAGIVGMMGAIVNYLVFNIVESSIISLLCASVVATILGEVFARVFKTPATLFVVVALIPLVPGGGMYRTMLNVVEGHINEAVLIGLDTIGEAGAIVIGFTFISSLFKVYKKAKELHL